MDIERPSLERGVKEHATLDEARELYGDQFFGPEKVGLVFGMSLRPEDIPPLPSKEKLKETKNIPHERMILALRVEEGKPARWVIFPHSVVAETANRDYVDGTRKIREFLKTNNLISPQELEETTDEVLDKIAKDMKTYAADAFQRLMNLRINQTRRHTAEDMIYFAKLFRKNKKRVASELDDSFECTNTYEIDNTGVWVHMVGKFTDHRIGMGGYIRERVKLDVLDSTNFAIYYNIGVRIII